MTHQQFINYNLGRKLDFDGKYKNQCVDLYRFYVRDVWNLPQTPNVIGAYQIMDTLPDTFDKFYSGIPQAGDVIVWTEKYVKNGHVGIVTWADKNGFKALQQNAPKPLQAVNIGTFTYENVIGWFRPKAKLKTTFMKATIIANNIAWDYKRYIPQISEWFRTYSSGKLELVFDTKDVSLGKPPMQDWGGFMCIDINWYREKVTPLGTGELTVFLANSVDYQNRSGTWGFMTFADDQKPVRTEVACDDEPNFPEAHPVVHRTFHEICHALYFLTGQPDRTHELLYVTQEQQQINRRTLLNEIDYKKLQEKLITIKPNKPMPQNQAKIVKSKNSNTVYVCYPVPSMEYLEEKSSLEGFPLPAIIPNTDTL